MNTSYPWTLTQAQALWESAEHHFNNLKVGPYDADYDCDSCACCRKWFKIDCRGCPISAHTGQNLCFGTLYYEVLDLQGELLILEDAKDLADWNQKQLELYQFLVELALGERGPKVK